MGHLIDHDPSIPHRADFRKWLIEACLFATGADYSLDMASCILNNSRSLSLKENRMSRLTLRWMLLISLILPFASLQVMGCGTDVNDGGACNTDDNCPEGQNCIDGECTQSDECVNFFSCEVDADCIQQDLENCEDGCCF
jgi:hypothetical protein